MRTTLSLILLPLLALALLPRPGTAQIRFDGIELSGGIWGWEGQDFTDVQGGPRLGVGPMLRIGELWNFGVEGVYGRADVQFVTNPIDIRETGVNAVVRRYLADPEGVHTFIQARGGWSRLTSEISEDPQEDPDSYSQSGFGLGAEFGVGFPPSRYLDVIWAASVGWNDYSQCEIFGPGPNYRYVEFGNACSAVRWGIRIGLVLGRIDG